MDRRCFFMLTEMLTVNMLGNMRDIDSVQFQNVEQRVVQRILPAPAFLCAMDIRPVQALLGDLYLIIAKILPE